MRNKYKGICYRCATEVLPGKGHFEKTKAGWRTQHAECAIKYRGTNYIHPSIIQHLRKENHAK